MPVDTRDGLDEARTAVRAVGDNPLLEGLARIGFAVSGLLHIVIGYTVGRVAWGGGGGQADQSGALATLSSNPAGTVLMWIIVVGLLALALWQLTVAFAPPSEDDGFVDRVKTLGKAGMYTVLGYTAFQFARGSGSSCEACAPRGSSGFSVARSSRGPSAPWRLRALCVPGRGRTLRTRAGR